MMNNRNGKRVIEVEHVEQKSKKYKLNISNTAKVSKIKSELYKPPTVEELNHLRETEILFNSNLFRLQTEELVKEMFVKKKRKREIEVWLQKFYSFTETLPEYCDKKFSDLNLCVEQREKSKTKSGFLEEIGKNYPFKLKIDQNTNIKLMRPCSTEIIGLYKINAIVGPTINVTLNVTIPKSCFNEKDYLNSRYLVKRALYLSYIGSHLKKANLSKNISYLYLNGNHLIPIIQVYPVDVKNAIVYIQVTAQTDTFKLSRFDCDKCNLRSGYFNNCIDNNNKYQYTSATKLSDATTTPFYNSTILHDLTLNINDMFCFEKLCGMKGACDGLILLTIWLRQRDLLTDATNGCNEFGGFTEQLLYCLVAYLIHINRINRHMSSYQVIRNIWNYLTQSEWDTPNKNGPSLCDDVKHNISKFDKFYNNYNVVFIDRTGHYNLAANLHLDIYLKIKFEANLALKYLDEGKLISFQALFMTKMNFHMQFDTIINIPNKNNCTIFDEIYKNVNDEHKLDHLNFKYPLIANYILDKLKCGLTDRIQTIVPKLKVVNTNWNLGTNNNEANTAADDFLLCFGLNLNTTNMYKIITKGPPAYDPLATQFRNFWEDKSELRRFKDGSITEAVYWSTTNIQEKRKISKDIIEFVLANKLKLKSFTVVYDQFESILKIFHESFVEEANLEILKIFDELVKKIRDLILPLNISTVQGISESFCHSDVYPPTSKNYKCGEKITYEIDNNILFKKGIDLKVSPPYIATIKGIIQMVHHSKWPNDLEAMNNLRTAFYLQMADQLSQSKQKDSTIIRTNVNHDHLDVLFRGLVFRFRLFHPKQIILLKKNKDDRGVISFRDTKESARLEKEYVILPKVIGALNGVHSEYPSFGPGTILMKRWLNAQLLDESHVSSIVVSLLSASIYLDSAPFQPPALPQIAFLRFLSLLIRHPFNIQPVVVNFNDEIDKQQRDDLETKFQQNRNEYPSMCIITPFDLNSILSENTPSKEILHRMSLLAKECLRTIEKTIHSQTLFNVVSLFKPNLTGYNVIIHLHPLLNPRRHESISSININKNTRSIIEFDEKTNDQMPIVNFNPVELYLRDLRTNYTDFALFFHDSYGGDVITVLWKPNVLQKQEFKISSVHGMKLISNEDKLQINIDALIEDFYILGYGIVKNIEIL